MAKTVVGALTVQQRDALLQNLVDRLGDKSPAASQMQGQQVVHHYVKNISGETAPAYACMQVVGTEEIGGQNYLKIDKPADENGDAGWYVFNSYQDIPNGELGIAYDGPAVRMLSNATGLTAGDQLGPQANSWYVGSGSLFIYAGDDDIRTDVVRAFVIGAGGGGNEIMFTIDDVYGVQEAASDHCDDQLRDAKSSYTATCVRKPCFMGTVPGADDNDKIVVHDYLGFLEGREEADVIGKTGLASYMVECHGYQTECKWIITWIDWFRVVQVVTGVRMTDTELCFDRKNVEVWDDCDLDPICIPLTDCVEY